MPRKQWSDKRERQYEHIKEGLEQRGRSKDVAEEIAARTVNKQRREAGETKSSRKKSSGSKKKSSSGGRRKSSSRKSSSKKR